MSEFEEFEDKYKVLESITGVIGECAVRLARLAHVDDMQELEEEPNPLTVEAILQAGE